MEIESLNKELQEARSNDEQQLSFEKRMLLDVPQATEGEDVPRRRADRTGFFLVAELEESAGNISGVRFGAGYGWYVHVRRRTSAYVDVRQSTWTYVHVHRRTWTYVDVRGRTATYGDVRGRTST